MGVITDLRVKVGDTVNIGDELLTVEPLNAELFSQDAMEVYASLYGDSESEETSNKKDEPKIITAPMAGKITSLFVSEDEYADPTKALMVISGERGLRAQVERF